MRHLDERNASGGQVASKAPKPTYEAPTVMPLGKQAEGSGFGCTNGSSNTYCYDGAAAGADCEFGGAYV